MQAICVMIGNTDNRLSQNEWAHFVVYTKRAIDRFVSEVRFSGGPETSAPWQNYCWVCDVEIAKIPDLIVALSQVRKSYRQDSVAVIVGTTSFV